MTNNCNDSNECVVISVPTPNRFLFLKPYLPSVASLLLLITGLLFDNYFQPSWFTGLPRLSLYLIAYFLVGGVVIIHAFKEIAKGSVFTEYLLMSIATIGAIAIGEYPEGVAVMLFYAIGELFQNAAVNRAKRSIKALLDIRPDTAVVLRNNELSIVPPEQVEIGETIQLKPGEKVPLDGILLNPIGSYNTAALTGESVPRNILQGEQVLAGMVNLVKVTEIKVNKKFADSSLARILDMVQNATARKAKTELFIRRFAKIYTPVVVFLAIALALLPYFFVQQYVFSEWLYRALIFLVISCPCALVISIPLGYFGGIGAASHNGILFKGSNYLDLITKVNMVVMDKTGTLTKGVFKVQKIMPVEINETDLLQIAASLERNSTHPVAKAIIQYAGNTVIEKKSSNVEEIAGHGLKGIVDGNDVLAGNLKLLKKFNVAYPIEIENIIDTIVVVAINGNYAGYITIADEIKEDAQLAVKDMHSLNIKTVMLSGDKQSIVDEMAKKLGIDNAYGDLLPENKVEKVEAIKHDKMNVVAFVGDGINDAPVLALSDVGIAMGALGSDAAIETADVVIQTDHPSKITTAIKIGKATNKIVWQNIILAFAVKALFLVLGAYGIATMWEAVFADVGVALLAITNAVRIQRMKF